MAWIQSYGCVTTAGDSVDELWKALVSGRALTGLGYMSGGRPPTVQELLVSRLMKAMPERRPSGRYGVILASTKGCSNDFIWSGEGESDPLTPVLNEFIRAAELNPERSICVSNACSSALAALELGQMWLKQGLDQVLVVAADAVTPFVTKGFQTLNLVTQSTPRPFAKGRDGFFLGEAAAAILIGNAEHENYCYLHPVGLDTEGYAVARPSHSGESLVRAAKQLPDLRPDVLLAHGTGTEINDATEDLAFSRLFPEGTPPVTGSKWCIGHTLGASAAIDVILACEMICRQEVFGLATTKEIDPSFKGNYLRESRRGPVRKVQISSLGFGGAHAMAMVTHDR